MGRYSGKKCRLVSMFGLTSGFFLVEIVVGYVTNSMALVADSFHMLSDIAALIIAFLSVKMAPKSWDKNTYGWARAEVLGALVNAVFLVALCFSITVESLKRFYEPEEIHDPQMILYVGAIGLGVNLLGLCLFHEHGHSHGGKNDGQSHAYHTGTHSHLTVMADVDDDDADEEIIIGRGDARAAENGAGVALKRKKGDETDHGHSHSASQMNMRGVFLHVLADALGSVVVIISALIMWLTDWEYRFYVDPGLSLVLVLLMMRSVWPLMIESALILLQTVPTHIEIDTLKKKLLENVDGVLAVHDFHVWQLTGDRIIASAHIRCMNLEEYMKVAENIKEFFHNEGIHSTTIQPEFVDYHPGMEYIEAEDCMLACPRGSLVNANCDSSKCCPTSSASAATAAISGQPKSKSANNTPILNRRPSSQQFLPNERRRNSSTVQTSTPSHRRSYRNNNVPINSNLSPVNGNANAITRSGRRSSGSSRRNPSRQSGRRGRDSESPNLTKVTTCPEDMSASADPDLSGIEPLPSSNNSLVLHFKAGSSDETPPRSIATNGGSDDSQQDTSPIFMTPRANSRVVRIISKQSNV